MKFSQKMKEECLFPKEMVFLLFFLEILIFLYAEARKYTVLLFALCHGQRNSVIFSRSAFTTGL